MRKGLMSISMILFLIFMISNVVIADEQIQNKTNVVIKNEIYGSSSNPELVYNIKTPKIIDYDFILALDSSGSIAEKNLQKKAILDAVPIFIEKIPKNYPDANFNISVLSWDDDIDFAYDANSGFNTNGTTDVKLVDINKAILDINTNFKNKFKTLETEITDFSIPIGASLDILGSEKNRPNNYHKNRRFIILVTGGSEFKPATDDLIRKAQEKRYNIYVIGMDMISTTSEMRKHLEKIAKYDEKQSTFLPAGDLYPPLNISLENALLSHLENATRAPVADSVKISESFYCYYKPNKNSVKVDGNLVDASFIKTRSNADGTNTIEIEIPGGLLPNKETKVAIDANLDLGYLPVTVAENRKPMILCSPNSNTPTGRFSFNWFNGEHFDLKINEAERGTDINSATKLTIKSTGSRKDTSISSFILENFFKRFIFLNSMDFEIKKRLSL